MKTSYVLNAVHAACNWTNCNGLLSIRVLETLDSIAVLCVTVTLPVHLLVGLFQTTDFLTACSTKVFLCLYVIPKCSVYRVVCLCLAHASVCACMCVVLICHVDKIIVMTMLESHHAVELSMAGWESKVLTTACSMSLGKEWPPQQQLMLGLANCQMMSAVASASLITCMYATIVQ